MTPSTVIIESSPDIIAVNAAEETTTVISEPVTQVVVIPEGPPGPPGPDSVLALTQHNEAANAHTGRITALETGLSDEEVARSDADSAITSSVDDEVQARTDHEALTTTAHGGVVAEGDARLTNKRVPVDGSVGLVQLESGLVIPASALDPVMATDAEVSSAVSSAVSAEATARTTAAATHAALSGKGGHVPAGGLPASDLSFDPATQTELDAEGTARTAAAAIHAALSGKGGHVPSGGLPVSDLSFDPATQAELDAVAAAKQDIVTAGGGLTKTGATLDVGEGQGIDVAADSIAVEWGSGTNQVRHGNDAAYTNARAPSGAAGGDLAGTFPSPTALTGLFRDGADGAATLDGTATVAWASKSGSVYTMTRDCALTALTINGGVTLKPNGWRIFVQGTLSNAGTIDGNGNAGNADGTVGAGINLITAAAGGGAGNVGAGSAGSGNTGSVASGGAGGLGSGGAGGGATALTFTNNANTLRSIYGSPGPANAGGCQYAQSARAIGGGQGGSGGGGDGVVKGGGGGAGGTPVVIFARTLTNTGTIRSNGGDGGSPASGNTGGGGGGGGGLVLIYTTSAPTLGTITVTGGTGGTKQGTGVNGSNGSTGTSLNIVLA